MSTRREKSSLDELREHLYTRGGLKRPAFKKTRLSSHNETVPLNWEDESKASEINTNDEWKPPTSPFKRLFIFSVGFFLIALVYAGYQFFAGSNTISSKNINLSVIGPSFVPGGDEFPIQVIIENKNSVSLEIADLTVEYTKGAVATSGTANTVYIRKELKSIPPGHIHQEIVKLTLYGEEGSDKNISFILEYRMEGSNAVFEKRMVYPVKISSAPINLLVEGPTAVTSGQDLTLRIRVSGNAAKDVPNTLLSIEYPSGFSFKNANPKPTFGNNIWRLGDLRAGNERVIVVSGTLTGEDGEERTFRILGGEPSQNDDKDIGVTYNAVFQTISVKRPFLETRLSLDGNFGNVVPISSSREVQGEIFWRNTLPAKIENAVIVLKFSGNALDKNSISVDRGFYNSFESSIVWSAENYPEFRSVETGASSRISFTMKPLPLFTTRSGLLKNPTIVIEGFVGGRVSGGSALSGDQVARFERSARVTTDFQVTPRSLYYIGPFENSGPIPPKAEVPTTYSIVLTALNSANDVTDATVTFTLPSYVTWLNIVSPSNEDITYDFSSGLVTWKLGRVLAGTGYKSSPREVAFQVRLIPSISQIGKTVLLTSDVNVTGTDEWSGARIEYKRSPLSTYLSTDPQFKESDAIIGQ